jgi:DNA-binding transcriptional MerR regulator
MTTTKKKTVKRTPTTQKGQALIDQKALAKLAGVHEMTVRYWLTTGKIAEPTHTEAVVVRGRRKYYTADEAAAIVKTMRPKLKN